MDQIKGAIRWMKKNRFWLGSALMSLLMIGIWFYVFDSIGSETKSSVGTIEGKIRTANNIQQVTAEGVEGDPAHPNTHSQEGIQVELSQTVDSIIEAWEKRVKDQNEILKWPAVVESERGEFASTFGQYNPPELIPDEWLQGDGKLRPLLKLYGENIPKQMVLLTGDDLLRTRWNFDPEHLEAQKIANAATAQAGTSVRPSGGYGGEDEYENGGGYSGGPPSGMGQMGRTGSSGAQVPEAGMMIDEMTGEIIDLNSYAVIWGSTNQLLWQTKMTSFKGRDDHQSPTNTPTPLQCYMLQQDLWLLEALFRIIREVNGDADANDISTIKRLDHVVFGRDVGGKLGELTPFDRRLGAVVSAEDDMMGGGAEFVEEMDGFEMDEMTMGGPGMGGPVLVSPVEGRYVDSNFEPLDAKKVKEILSSDSLPETELELIVSKRVPVRIAVRMKETEIVNFMAACANSPFAFEIQQVRWNKHFPGEEIPIGGGPGTGSARRGGPSGFGSQFGRGGPMGAMGTHQGPVLKSTPVEIRTNYDVNVEFYGIVKIYNPVRPKVLRAAAGLEEGVDPNDAASVVSPQPDRS